MKLLAVAFVGVTCLISVVWCYSNYECKSFDKALQDINYELDQEASRHTFRFPYGQFTYIGKTKHVLKELNNKIKQAGVSPQCTALENAVKVNSMNYGLKIDGLEDGVTRLEKLVNFLDERNQMQRNELEEDLKEANATIARLNQTIVDLSKKMNVFVAAFHGRETGKNTELHTETIIFNP